MSNKTNKSAESGAAKARQGKRYTAKQKKEILDFVDEVNASKGRGGQAAAAEKFGVSALTISNWTKKLSASTPQAKSDAMPEATPAAKSETAPVAKPESAPATKSAPAAKAKTSAAPPQGKRYTPEQKQEVLDYVADYNATNGRGGQAAAAEKFGVAALTISNWTKKLGSGTARPAKTAAKPKVAAKPKTKTGARRGRPPGSKGKAKKAEAPKVTTTASAEGDITKKLAELQRLHRVIALAETEIKHLKERFDSIKASL